MTSTAKERQEAREALLHDIWLLQAQAVKDMLASKAPGELRASSIQAVTAWLKMNATNAGNLKRAEDPGPLGGLVEQLPVFNDAPVTEATRVEEEEHGKATEPSTASSDKMPADYLAEMPSFDGASAASEAPSFGDSEETVEK